MFVELVDIGSQRKPFEIIIQPDEIDLDVEGTLLTFETKFRGETELIEGKAHVRGELEPDISIDCTRCLDPVRRKLKISFDSIFVGPETETGAAELALAFEELDESIAVGGKIDLKEAAREQILLALPEQTFCREDCKGLCPQCGENRNLIDCKCKENETDPRWAALKRFK